MAKICFYFPFCWYRFALRILIFLVFAWMTALVFNSLMMAGPLLLGRALFQAAADFLNGFKCDGNIAILWCLLGWCTCQTNWIVFMAYFIDFCSFIVGSCVIRAVVIYTKYGLEHAQTRGVGSLLSQIRQYCMTAFKICALLSLGVCNLISPFCLAFSNRVQNIFVFNHNSGFSI